MEIIAKLTVFAEKVQNSGHLHIASDIDTATTLFVKTAKEIGGQGYWVRNERCWAGCYRKKRVASPNKPAQKVWFECLEEFQEAVKGDDNEWAKYAGTEVTLKTADTQKMDENLIASIDHSNVGTALYYLTNKAIQTAVNNYALASESLSSASENLLTIDLALAKEAAELSSMMMKEARGWQGMQNLTISTMNKLSQARSVNVMQTLQDFLNQLNYTLINYVGQKRKFEKAVDDGERSGEVPNELAQVLRQGLRPLSQKSISNMNQAVGKYLANDPKQTNKAIGQPPMPKPEMQPEPDLKFRPDEPAPEGSQMTAQEAMQIMQKLSPEKMGPLLQQAKQILNQIMSEPVSAKRSVFSLVKESQITATPPWRRAKPIPGGRGQKALAPKVPQAPVAKTPAPVTPAPVAPAPVPQPAAIPTPFTQPVNTGLSGVKDVKNNKGFGPREIKKHDFSNDGGVFNPQLNNAAPPTPASPVSPPPTPQPASAGNDFTSFESQVSQLPPDAQSKLMVRLGPLLQQYKSLLQQNKPSKPRQKPNVPFRDPFVHDNLQSSKRRVFKLV